MMQAMANHAHGRALACAVSGEEPPGGHRASERGATILGALMAAHGHASGPGTEGIRRAPERSAAPGTGQGSTRPVMARREERTRLFCAPWRAPYACVSPREVRRIEAPTRPLARFRACSGVSPWGMLPVPATATQNRRPRHNTTLHQASSPVVGNPGLFWGCWQQSHVAGCVAMGGPCMEATHEQGS